MTRKSAKEMTVRVKYKPMTDLEQFYGYDFILLVDPHTLTFTQIGGRGRVAQTLYRNNPVHQEALAKALKRGVFHYEWTDLRGKSTTLYQTTCVALKAPDGRSSGVLSFSRDITQGMYVPDWGENVLQDSGSPRTFAQILLAARETEKKEISKALHDEIGSSAVMLTSLLSLVRAGVQAGNKRQVLSDLAQLDAQIKASVERIKNVVVSLRPPSLENKGGLGGAVRDLLENISAFSGVPHTFECDLEEDQQRLSDNVKIILYRIVQEALTNIVKHARAKHIRVDLKQIGGTVRLVVCDDGIGFKTSRQRSIEHVGLLAMRESVELIGGTITIKSTPDKGTRIEVSCPSFVYGG